MKKIKEIINELKINWYKPSYFVVDTKQDKAVILSINGVVSVAKNKGIDTSIITETDDLDVIVHDLGNELESMGIYVEPLQIGDEITYQEIEVVRTLNDFLGE